MLLEDDNYLSDNISKYISKTNEFLPVAAVPIGVERTELGGGLEL